jgi:hypothetical protein
MGTGKLLDKLVLVECLKPVTETQLLCGSVEQSGTAGFVFSLSQTCASKRCYPYTNLYIVTTQKNLSRYFTIKTALSFNIFVCFSGKLLKCYFHVLWKGMFYNELKILFLNRILELFYS